MLACKGSTVSLHLSWPPGDPGRLSPYQVPLEGWNLDTGDALLLQPYGGIQMGPAKTVKVVAGKTMNLPLTVAYVPTGVADGSVTVTGAPRT